MSTLSTLAKSVMSGTILSLVGDAVTIAAPATETTTLFADDGRPLDTSTQWASGTAYTASVQVAAQGAVAAYEGMGITGRELLEVYLRPTVTIEEGYKLTYQSKVYIVRHAAEDDGGYKLAVCTRAEGMETNQ